MIALAVVTTVLTPLTTRAGERFIKGAAPSLPKLRLGENYRLLLPATI